MCLCIYPVPVWALNDFFQQGFYPAVANNFLRFLPLSLKIVGTQLLVREGKQVLIKNWLVIILNAAAIIGYPPADIDGIGKNADQPRPARFKMSLCCLLK